MSLPNVPVGAIFTVKPYNAALETARSNPHLTPPVEQQP